MQVLENETNEAVDFITVTIYRIPGTRAEVVLNGERTVGAAMAEAGLTMDSSMEARVGSLTLTFEQVDATRATHILADGDVIQLVARTKGN